MTVDELRAMLAATRQAFDEGFARPPAPRVQGSVAVLEVRIGSDRFALRLSELSGLHLRGALVRLPSAVPALRGLAGIRSRAVPVFSLAELLGYHDAGNERWLALTGTDQPIALAFGELERFHSLPPDALAKAAERLPEHVFAKAAERLLEHVEETARVGDRTLPVVSVPSVIRVLHARTAPPVSPTTGVTS